MHRSSVSSRDAARVVAQKEHLASLPPAQPPAAKPATPEDQLAAVAKVLGCPATTNDVKQAVAALFAQLEGGTIPPTEQAPDAVAARKAGLSASQLSAIRATPGCTVQKFVATLRGGK